MSKHTDTERLEYLAETGHYVDIGYWRPEYYLRTEGAGVQSEAYLDFRAAIDAAMDGKDVPE